MNSHAVITSVSKTLLNLLWTNMKDDAQINSIVAAQDQMSLSSPNTTESETSRKLSLFLYQITEFSTMKNTAMPLGEINKIRQPPLYLALHYLVTPFTKNAESDQILLEKTMRVFSDNAVLRGPILQSTLAEDGADLRLTMNPLSIDDLNKLWTMLGTHYRLCLSYTVAPVTIEIAPKKETEVVESESEYAQS